MSVKNVNGWWWPEADTECQRVAHYLESLKEAVAYVMDFSVAIQAGGNTGVWPAALALKFDHVYTAEPDAENFLCLCLNVEAQNVFKMQCGFGNGNKPASMIAVENNCGAGHLDNAGNIPIIDIDSMSLDNVGLIALDVEGMELAALLGAEQTIKRSHPVILTEQKGLGLKYGYEDETIGEFLKELGYHEKTRVARDVIYVHGMRK